MHRPTNTWWERNMVCLSADQFAENHLESGTKWNFDVEMDSGIPGPTLEPRRDEGMPTATAPMEIPTVPSTCTSARKTRIRDASSQQRGGQDEDGDLRPILHESCENEGDWQSRPLLKHSRSVYSKAAERGRQIDRYWPDHHYTEVTGTQERHQRNDGIVEKTCHFRGQVHHYCGHHLGDSCNLPGIRVPKCTRR